MFRAVGPQLRWPHVASAHASTWHWHKARTSGCGIRAMSWSQLQIKSRLCGSHKCGLTDACSLNLLEVQLPAVATYTTGSIAGSCFKARKEGQHRRGSRAKYIWSCEQSKAWFGAACCTAITLTGTAVSPWLQLSAVTQLTEGHVPLAFKALAFKALFNATMQLLTCDLFRHFLVLASPTIKQQWCLDQLPPHTGCQQCHTCLLQSYCCTCDRELRWVASPLLPEISPSCLSAESHQK